MTRGTRNRIIVVCITVCWGFFEWLLWELRRAPYLPPHDMRTFLGRDRDAVFGFMFGAFLVWIFVVSPICLSSEFSRKDYFYFGLLLALMGSIIGYLVRFPWWPVTPWNLMWS